MGVQKKDKRRGSRDVLNAHGEGQSIECFASHRLLCCCSASSMTKSQKRPDRLRLHSGYAGHVSSSHRPMLVCTECRQTHFIMGTFQHRSMEAYGLKTGRPVGKSAVVFAGSFLSTRQRREDSRLLDQRSSLGEDPRQVYLE